ncbi:MAG TPA: hypothetical protein VFF52_19925 [Isosphaeraceae bacterium]|nr:hypothetical protein [Isosphaeraceae bacterium]
MQTTNSLATSSLVLSIAVAAIAVALGARQWFERAAREPSLPSEDRKHFARQDLRRWIGVALMLILAVGIFAGSRIPPSVPAFPMEEGVRQGWQALAGAWIEPVILSRVNLRFVLVWTGLILLLPALLVLALFDWLATRRYAQRQRRSMAHQRIEILRQTLRPADSHHNGYLLDHDPDGD